MSGELWVALAAELAGNDPVRVVGSCSKVGWCGPVAGREVAVGLSGIVEFEPDDQYVEAWAGTPLKELQAECAARGLALPLPDEDRWGRALAGYPGTVGGLVAMNLPHALAEQCGGPRDWILRVELLTAEGRLVKAGCKAVKNVAGYDVPKLMVGSRGALGVLLKVGLRLWPTRAMPEPDASVATDRPANWIQRTLRTDFDRACEAACDRLVAADRASCTLWAGLEQGERLPRFSGDWVLCPWLQEPPEAPTADAVRRLKQAADPHGRLNPGVFGWI